MDAPRDRPDDDLRQARPPLWLYGAGFAALAAAGYVLGEVSEEAREAVPEGIDAVLPDWVRAHRERWPMVTRSFRAITELGNFPVAHLLVVSVALALYLLHRAKVGAIRRSDGFFWLGVTASGALLNVVLKLVFRRDRPPNVDWLIHEKGFSFPSGHAVFAGVFFGMLALLIARPAAGRPWWLRVGGAASCLAMSVLVAASRVWLGVHYPTDVIGGLTLGWGWALAAWLIRSGWARWRLHRDGLGHP
jgi:undecaprenyl-diphosphatase